MTPGDFAALEAEYGDAVSFGDLAPIALDPSVGKRPFKLYAYRLCRKRDQWRGSRCKDRNHAGDAVKSRKANRLYHYKRRR